MKQSINKHLSGTLLALCVSLVGAVFTYKYGSRLVDFALLLSCAYFVIGFIAMRYVAFAANRVWRSRRLFVCTLLVVIATLFVLLITADPNSNNVDRWSAIHNFLQRLFEGQYPYGAQTHLDGYGSTFPAWQLWHLPYYLLGNVGYSFIVCLIIFLYSLRKAYSTPVAFKALVMLALCPSFWYEAMVISDLMPNMLLLSAFIILFNSAMGIDSQANRLELQDSKSNIGTTAFLLICSVLCGLFFSTRLITVIPLFYAMFWIWTRQKWTLRIVLALLHVVVFVLTFLPFALWNAEMLFSFEDNPFSLQTRQGDMLDVFLLALMVVAAMVIMRKRLHDLSKATPFTLLAFIVMVFVHRMIASGFTLDFWGSVYDHTYLSMFIPFAVAQLAVAVRHKL